MGGNFLVHRACRVIVIPAPVWKLRSQKCSDAPILLGSSRAFFCCEMRHPFQRLVAKTCPEKLLLAAAGPNLYAYSLANGTLASSWIRTTEAAAPAKAHVGKKRKLSAGAEEATQLNNEEREQDDASNAGAQSAGTSSITRLAITRDGGHVVAATDSDKSVRVLTLGQAWQLEQFSERSASPSHKSA